MKLSSIIFLFALLVSNGWTSPLTPSDGETIYRQGLLPSGKMLRGQRDNEGNVPKVACINCHRRSGLGSTEGQIRVPAITGTYLFAPGSSDQQTPNTSRKTYTDSSFARAIRKGIRADGKSMSYLMPRYQMDDSTLTSLITYLKTLSAGPVPGVSDDTLHFATVITPDADPVKRQGMLDVIQRFFAIKSTLIGGQSRPMHASRQIMYRVNRKWQLHIWELTGDPETWGKQLHARLAAEPVFAVISGVGGTTWTPIHQFCEEASIPCLLPNVDVPVVAEQDFYSIYFSQGVFLEAGLMSRQLQENQKRLGLLRVIQVFREGDIGEPAAKALGDAATAVGLNSVYRPLKSGDSTQSIIDLFKDVNANDALVLWLRPGDIKALPTKAVNSPAVFISGLMGGLEDTPLPESWRKISQLTYPFDLPGLRKGRMGFPLTWFKIQRIPVVAERIQSDTFIACGILSETLDHMQDSFVRDYLVERVESMLGNKPDTGYYPRMGLAPGQRFTSKGGYFVHFTEASGQKIVADGDWVIPQ